MIFLAALCLLVLVGIHRTLDRIADDIRAIRNWYCEDQK